MLQRNTFFAAVLVATFCCATSAYSAQVEDVAIGKDLKVTIALHGQACDQVIDVKRNADSDYVATCKDGNRYRVFVDAAGRVIVKKQ